MTYPHPPFCPSPSLGIPGQVRVAEQLHMAKESMKDLCQRLDEVERERQAEAHRALAAEVEARKAKESQAAVLVQLQVRYTPRWPRF